MLLSSPTIIVFTNSLGISSIKFLIVFSALYAITITQIFLSEYLVLIFNPVAFQKNYLPNK